MPASADAVGVVAPDDPTPEQAAALEWCRDAVADAERVAPADLAAGAVDVDAFDVLWWHADEPPAAAAVEDAAPGVRAHLRSGGGLLLSLRALEAVDALGVDPVAPDATGIDDHHEPTGLLWKAVHADHPAFDGFDDLRVATVPPGVHPFARYDDVLPARGEVLAATVHGPDDWPDQVSAVAWPTGGAVGAAGDGRDATAGDPAGAVGDGRDPTEGGPAGADDEESDAGVDLAGADEESDAGVGPVVGVGAGLRFDVGVGCAHARARLTSNLLDVLADGPDGALDGRPKTAAQLRAARAALDADDHHRPAYHLSPPGNWLNDPNGLIHHDGTYHVFYQYNPAGPAHGTIHWGHATSDDLVTWRDEPVALAPSPDGPDRDGCWSGCAVAVDGTPTVIYTGGRGREQLPCRATAVDDGLTAWVKDDGNPIIEAPPPDLDVLETDHWAAEFRDHCVWRADGTWYQLVGTGIRGVGGAALLYAATADDLSAWRYVGPLLVGDWPGSGDVWECPELLPFGDRSLLHVSDYEAVRYFVGRFDPDAGTFDVERRGVLDHGDLYAPQSMRLDDGRYLTWGWIPEDRPAGAQWDAGWAGVLSVPRELDVVDGELRQRPARELTGLRAERLARVDGPLDADEPTTLARGDAVEVVAELAPGDADAVALDVLASPGGDERTTLRVTDEAVVLDRSASGPDADAGAQGVPLPETVGPTEVHAFVDRSVVEVFVDGRRALASRVYPSGADSDRVRLRGVDGRATAGSVDVWRLASAW